MCTAAEREPLWRSQERRKSPPSSGSAVVGDNADSSRGAVGQAIEHRMQSKGAMWFGACPEIRALTSQKYRPIPKDTGS